VSQLTARKIARTALKQSKSLLFSDILNSFPPAIGLDESVFPKVNRPKILKLYCLLKVWCRNKALSSSGLRFPKRKDHILTCLFMGSGGNTGGPVKICLLLKRTGASLLSKVISRIF
jgi:hypothetical protein